MLFYLVSMQVYPHNCFYLCQPQYSTGEKPIGLLLLLVEVKLGKLRPIDILNSPRMGKAMEL